LKYNYGITRLQETGNNKCVLSKFQSVTNLCFPPPHINMKKIESEVEATDTTYALLFSSTRQNLRANFPS